jgi:hypothetical protein
MDIKPIETHYLGYRFRSRAEARWAAFYHAIGLTFAYETEGFDLGSLGWYLPDFWIPQMECWVEIKGKEPTAFEIDKVKALIHLTNQDAMITWGPLPNSADFAPMLDDFNFDEEYVITNGNECYSIWIPDNPDEFRLNQPNDPRAKIIEFGSCDWKECQICHALMTVHKRCGHDFKDYHISERILKAYDVARKIRFEPTKDDKSTPVKKTSTRRKQNKGVGICITLPTTEEEAQRQKQEEWMRSLWISDPVLADAFTRLKEVEHSGDKELIQDLLKETKKLMNTKAERGIQDE